jgi:hypothetical protein
MISSVELRRLFNEWRWRLKRVQAVLQPPVWSEEEWRQFAQALTLLLQKHGATWVGGADGTSQFWDLRWAIREGGELICQAEQKGSETLSLVVAQTGGWAEEAGSYTWLWAEFGPDGHFSRDPYWVDGTWKEALISLLLPYQYQSNFFLAAPTETPAALMLGGGTPPAEPEPPAP